MPHVGEARGSGAGSVQRRGRGRTEGSAGGGGCSAPEEARAAARRRYGWRRSAEEAGGGGDDATTGGGGAREGSGGSGAGPTGAVQCGAEDLRRHVGGRTAVAAMATNAKSPPVI